LLDLLRVGRLLQVRGLLGDHSPSSINAGIPQPEQPVAILTGQSPMELDKSLPHVIPAPRGLQQVSTLATRKTVITWMVQDASINSNPGLYVRTIRAFPEYFRGKKIANFVRATRWWVLRNEFCNENENANSTAAFSCSRSRLRQQKQMLMKAAPGRGTKRLEWVMWLYLQLLNAFDLFRNTSVKFSSKLLIELALSVLLDPTPIYTNQSRDPKDNRLLIEKLNHSWIQRFMDVHNIVLLSQCGKLSCSLRKEI
jgi:hypothetical protein